MFAFNFKKIFTYIAPLFGAMFFCLDRYFKIIAINSWPKISQPLIAGYLNFNFVPNYNIAFSLPLSGPFLTIFIFLIILFLIGYLFYKRLAPLSERLPLLFIILGSSSNFWDRINYEYVIDYLDLRWFTVFNIADAMISLSVIYLLIFHLLAPKKFLNK